MAVTRSIKQKQKHGKYNILLVFFHFHLQRSVNMDQTWLKDIDSPSDQTAPLPQGKTTLYVQ